MTMYFEYGMLRRKSAEKCSGVMKIGLNAWIGKENTWSAVPMTIPFAFGTPNYSAGMDPDDEESLKIKKAAGL